MRKARKDTINGATKKKENGGALQKKRWKKLGRKIRALKGACKRPWPVLEAKKKKATQDPANKPL